MKILHGVLVAVLATASVVHAGPGADDANRSGGNAPPERKVVSIYMAAAREQRDPGTKVWTNADLERLGAGAWATTSVAVDETDAQADSGADALSWLQESVERKQSRTERIATAQAELDAAEAKLENLEKELLATVNPFSARPRLSEEEQELRRTTRENAEERNERVKRLTDEARAEVQAARSRLRRAQSGG